MSVFLDDQDVIIHQGDVADVLPTLEAGSVDCVITSPPYWGLRDYGTEGQLGLEPTPDAYLERMVGVFRQVRRVLAEHGSCFLNMGDGFLDKQLVGMPWRLALALQADGWWLRADVIWSKPNPMPESVTDRPTKAHEYVFLLTKAPRYWYDADAVREPGSLAQPYGRLSRQNNVDGSNDGRGNRFDSYRNPEAGRNLRSVWEIVTQPYPEAHFATFPEELVRRCLLAGCPERVCGTCGKPSVRIVETEYIPHGDNVGKQHNENLATAARDDKMLHRGPQSMKYGRATRLDTTVGWTDCGHDNWRPGVCLDPFLGSGTTAHVARKHGRRCVGVELNADYCELAARRLAQLSLLS